MPKISLKFLLWRKGPTDVTALGFVICKCSSTLRDTDTNGLHLLCPVIKLGPDHLLSFEPTCLLPAASCTCGFQRVSLLAAGVGCCQRPPRESFRKLATSTGSDTQKS